MSAHGKSLGEVMHTRAYRQGYDQTIKCQRPENGEGVGGGRGARRGRGGGGRRSEPNYHNFPFVETVLTDESFAKMASRVGALERWHVFGGDRTARNASTRMIAWLC